MNVNMNNVILIAQKVTIESGSINGGMNQWIAQFIGTEYNVIEGGAGNDHPVNPDNPDPDNPDPVNPDNPEIDWSVDTDGDGLPDDLEKEIGTDPEVEDTDGDGLSDYEEIFITGTDPLNPTSVQSGVSDADADSDGDGIPNREELDKGLNPASADSDYDGISDYDELYVYGTDPVNADSDGDGIKDGDEISLGLDPLNGSTNGVPDGEYMIHQTVDADSEALAGINTADSPYSMSIEVDAAGYVAGNLVAGETPYAHTIENDAILGNAVGLEYQGGNVESVTLKFEIAEAYRENEIGMFPGEEEIEGIKRLNVFKYFEDINMLLPIEAKFDMENHIVYTEVDEFGTYCLMDLEKWLLNFDLPETEAEVAALSIDLYEDEGEMQPEEGIYFGCTDEYNEEDSIWQEGEFIEPEELESLVTREEAYVMEDIPMLMALDLEDGVSNDIDNSNIDNASIDIVFILQCAGLSPTDFQREKDMIVQVAQRLENNHPDASVRIGVLIFQYKYASWLKADGEKWFTSSVSLKNVLSRQGYNFITNDCRISEAFGLFCKEADLREDAAKFVYTVYNGNTGYGFWDVYNQNSICNKFDIHYSEIFPKGYKYASEEQGKKIMALIAYTKGIFMEFDGFTAGEIYGHIRKNVAPVVQPVDFTVLLPTGWKQITLTQPLNSSNGANSDTDSLTDWEEVNTNMISWDANGEIDLPTIYECMQSTEVSYAQYGLNRFLSRFTTEPNLDDCQERVDYVVHNCEILPIYSNPVDEDTDRDGIYDGIDIRPMEEDEYGDKFDELINDGYIDMKTMIQTGDGFTICMTPVSEIFNQLGYKECDIYTFNENHKLYGSDVDPDEYYLNDWFIYAVTDGRNVSYSILKLCEYGDLSPKVAVPFMAMNIDIFHKYTNENDRIEAHDELVAVTTATNNSKHCDFLICNYFINPWSEGFYLLAELYATKIASEECSDGSMLAVIDGKEPDKYCERTLCQFELGYENSNGIYDRENNCLLISDIENLSRDEIKCILACRTGNPNANSFAAEIQFHAVVALYNDDYDEIFERYPIDFDFIPQTLANLIAYLPKRYLYEHAVIADLSVDEQVGFIEKYLVEPIYKDNNDARSLMVIQEIIWGNR